MKRLHCSLPNYPRALVLVSLAASLAACQRKPAAPPQMPPPEVAVVRVAREKVTLTSELPGRTAPYRIAEVRPQANGLILKRLFTEGADVQAGQDLYEIDAAPFEAAIASARAGLARSETMLPALRSRADRLRGALAEKAVSQQDFDDADAALKQGEADVVYWKSQVQTAQVSLNYTRIRSPISGRIGRSAVTDGAIVTAYQPVPLAAIQQLDPMYVDVPQSATEMLRLRSRAASGAVAQGDQPVEHVKLILSDGSAYPLEGTLQFRDVSVDPMTGSVILRMVFPNPQGVLLPGMYVRAVITEGVNEHAMLVPQQAVSRDPRGQPMALIVNAAGMAEARTLVLERAVADRWLVSSGLEEGDQLITEGLQKARPGAPVRLAGQAPAGPGGAAPGAPSAPPAAAPGAAKAAH